MNKGDIRTAIKQFLVCMDDQQRHQRSLAACENLIRTKEFKNAQTIMIYLSMPQELETSTLAIKAWNEGKNIAVPRVEWGVHRMDAIEIKSLDVDMKTSGPGVREPVEGKVVSLGLIDMVVIPGLAFDRSGYRVGRGRGFYDRFLAQQEFKAVRCALCFHEQILENPIPTEPHDIPMDLIVTDTEVLRFSHQTAVEKHCK